MSEYPLKCTLCGTPVKVVGKTTMHYESAYDKLKASNKALRDILKLIAGMYLDHPGDSEVMQAWAKEALKTHGPKDKESSDD